MSGLKISTIRLHRPRVYESILFIALLSGPPCFRERDPFASLRGEIDWVVILNAVVWGLGALWIFYRFNNYALVQRLPPRLKSPQLLALSFALTLFLSAFVSPAPLLTAFRITQIIIMVLFGYFWVNRFGIDSMIRHLFFGIAILGIAIGLSGIFIPDLVFPGEGHRLRGDYIANTGSIAVMGLVLLLGYPVLKNRFLYLLFLALFGTLLVLSMTRSAYAAMLFFVLLALIRFPDVSPVRRFLFLGLVSFLTALSFHWMPLVVSWIIREPESIYTLSGRIPLWEYVISITLDESPWVGLGFYANRAVTMASNPGLGTSHSAFVEVLSGGGIIAFSTFTLMIAVLLFLTIKLFLLYGKEPRAFVITGLFASVLLIGVVSEEMVIASPTGFTFWMMVSIIPATIHDIQPSTSKRRDYYEGSSLAQLLSANRRRRQGLRY